MQIGSGTLTTFDLFVMQQLLIGNLSEFPGCDSWVFVDAEHQFEEAFDGNNIFPYPSVHTMMLDKEDAVVDFIGIKVGDVLGRARPNYSSLAPIASDRSSKVIPLQISEQIVEAGAIFEVDFTTKALDDLVSYQLSLDYNMENLELIDFIANPSKDLASTVVGYTRNNLNISWYDGAGIGID